MKIARKFLGLAVAMGASGLIVGCNSDHTVRASGPTGVTNILLVHGAWADGSSWSKVIPLLQADGYSVVAVQLPLSSLADDASAVQRAIALEPGPMLLVGHSYGGAVITQAGNDPKVEGLLYVAAFAPDAGESGNSLGATFPATPVATEVRPDMQGFTKLTATGISDDFAPELSDAERATLSVTQGPTSYPNALGGTVTTPAWKTRPSWFIVAANDRVISPALEQMEAKRAQSTTITIPSCHVAMLAHPTDVAAFIEKAAASLKP
jgi:pimeloyl-ACP methyl ester carboxylesterase